MIIRIVSLKLRPYRVLCSWVFLIDLFWTFVQCIRPSLIEVNKYPILRGASILAVALCNQLVEEVYVPLFFDKLLEIQ